MEKEDQKNPWKVIIGWCPLCWWRQSSEFHFETPEATVQKTLKSKHRTDMPNCTGKVRCELPVSKPR